MLCQDATLLMCSGCTTVRVLLATKDAAVLVITDIKGFTKNWVFSWLDVYLPDLKACIVSWFDDHIPQHANQMRYLLGELPRGQSLPTIEEEDEEALGNNNSATHHSTAHLADINSNTSKSVDGDSNSANVFDMHARTV